jgi:hypothetical protein
MFYKIKLKYLYYTKKKKKEAQSTCSWHNWWYLFIDVHGDIDWYLSTRRAIIELATSGVEIKRDLCTLKFLFTLLILTRKNSY